MRTVLFLACLCPDQCQAQCFSTSSTKSYNQQVVDSDPTDESEASNPANIDVVPNLVEVMVEVVDLEVAIVATVTRVMVGDIPPPGTAAKVTIIKAAITLVIKMVDSTIMGIVDMDIDTIQAVLILACLAVASALPPFPANDLEGSDLSRSDLEEYVPYLSNVEADVGRYKRSAEPIYHGYGRNNYGYGHNRRGFGSGYHNRGFGGGYQSFGRRNRGYGGYHGYH
eukprot:maker-scaffold509_size151631-snap-gene-0.14 protein:Tk05949 transcript:maker-scaffold509_size151631-snap-gene-0.14-mRNA-1 annotation:"tpa: cuticle protein"